MIVTCHRLHFLPWIPYLNRIAHSDLFLVLDDFAFRKNYFLNRTIVCDKNGRQYWVTAPVTNAGLGTPLSEIHVCRDSRAFTKSINRLREAYRVHLNNPTLLEVFASLENSPVRLLDLNMILMKIILRELGLGHVKILPISQVVPNKGQKDRILAALQVVEASSVIVGMGGMATANDLSRWSAEGIKLEFQESQKIPLDCSLVMGKGISILHDLLTLGVPRTAEIVSGYWLPKKV